MFDTVREAIENRGGVYAVIGMGYVGLPLAVEAAEAGWTVLGFDISTEKIARLKAGDSYIEDISSERLVRLVTSGKLIPTANADDLAKATIFSICVPTPLGKRREPDVSFIESATAIVAKQAQAGSLVILESTTYPGTTREIVVPALEQAGHTVGSSVFVAFSPERVDPGNPRYGIKNTPKVVGGVTPRCTELAAAFYRTFVEQVHTVSSPEAAEMAKLLENIFRAVNIALVNELMLLSDRMGVNIWEVIEAAATKPFGYMKFLPGPGLGGHCIPIDPFYLSWKAKQFDFWTEFIELAGRISENIPYYVVEKAYRALNREGKCLKGARVLVLGLAYKKDIGDVRHSPALKIVRLLKDEGCELRLNDPHVVDHDIETLGLPLVELTEEEVRSADLVLLVTDHSAYDYDWIARHAQAILDTRNAFAHVSPEARARITVL